MTQNRRKFFGVAVANAAALAVAPRQLFGALPSDLMSVNASDDWDQTWLNRLTGKYRAVFDNAEVESGYGVWRASAWAGQYADVVKASPADLSPVIVLRHNAIVLAMQHAYWDKYGVGAAKKITHPLTGKPISRNPALLDEKDGIPLPFSNAGLRKQLDRGVVVLACNLALQDCIDTIQKADKISEADARKKGNSVSRSRSDSSAVRSFCSNPRAGGGRLICEG